ncbi:MAG: leucyl aminopeptidase [Pseudomonadota bacterium]
MKINFCGLEDAKKGEVLALPIYEDQKNLLLEGDFKQAVESMIALGDIKGKKGEVVLVYPAGGNSLKRIAVVGLGKTKDVNCESIREAYSALARKLLSMKIAKAHLVMPILENMQPEDMAGAVAEGVFLTDYSFDKYKSYEKKEEKYQPIESISFIGAMPKKAKDAVREKRVIADAVIATRDLQNDSADVVSPEYLADQAKAIAKIHGLRCTLLGKKDIEKLGMGLLLAVNRGSAKEPRLIVLEYHGNPKSKDLTAVIGKGITFDSGGYNLKPTKFIETMREDMAGAAIALNVISAAAGLKLKTNLAAVVPATENMIGSNAYKPGDVYRSMSGKTVEIGNTDAEGRLILADAITYAVRKIKPTRIVDFATLTGAMTITLADILIGAMTNEDHLYEKIYEAGEATYERVWKLPIYDEFRDRLKSDIADMNNAGGREGGSIIAAAFLEKFVEGIPWLHLDIAGVSWLEKDRHYIPKHGTGVGVRLMIEFLKRV